MSKKIIIQVILFLVIILFTSLFFFKYLFKKETEISQIQKKSTLNLSENSNNTINDMEYSSSDSLGNKYVIKARFGEILNENTNIILMKGVDAFIILNDDSKINITSSKAVYNILNYDTNFKEDVLIINTEHNLRCDNVDLLFKDHKIEIYNNIVYNNLNTEFLADKIEIDLITKNSKIYMNDKEKKIKVIHNNNVNN